MIMLRSVEWSGLASSDVEAGVESDGRTGESSDDESRESSDDDVGAWRMAADVARDSDEVTDDESCAPRPPTLS